MGCRVSVRGEGWEVDAFVTATDLWSFTVSYKLSSYLTDFFYVKIFALGRIISLMFLSCECQTGT